MKTGTIVICSVNDMPLIKHYGIIINQGGKDLVAHNSPDNKNRYGGTVVIEPYTMFVKSRKLINAIITNASEGEILNCCRENKTKKFDSLAFNCFQFVNQCAGKWFQSLH